MESKIVGNGLDLKILWLQKPIFILKLLFDSDLVHLLVAQVLRILGEGSGTETIHPKASGLLKVYMSQRSILF